MNRVNDQDRILLIAFSEIIADIRNILDPDKPDMMMLSDLVEEVRRLKAVEQVVKDALKYKFVPPVGEYLPVNMTKLWEFLE